MKKFLIALSIGFLCVLMINMYFETTETALADSVIRFHVLANSNSPEDQELKLKVRNRIISEMSNLFNSDGDIELARTAIEKNMDKISAVARDEIRKNGYDYDVRMSLGESNFPTKEYGDVVLPAGSYEALRVEIGAADGQNWWCVLFPPLCFVDESTVSFDTKEAAAIENSVGKNNAGLIKKDKSPTVKIKFKSYEIWQTGKQKIAYMLGFN